MTSLVLNNRALVLFSLRDNEKLFMNVVCSIRGWDFKG